jgi:hypothetical protein
MATEAAGVVPMTGLPVPEMATQMAAVPVIKTMHRKLVIMEVVMRVVMSEMMQAVTKEPMSEEPVTDESMAETAVETTETMRHGVDLSKGDAEEAGRDDGDRFSQKHQALLARSAGRKTRRYYRPSELRIRELPRSNARHS